MDTKKKNIVLIIIGVVLVLALIVISATINEKEDKAITNSATSMLENAQTESSNVKEDEKKDFTQIDIDKYLEYLKGDTNKLVLIARPTCHYCQIAEPILQNLAYKYDIEINYLNTDNFTEDDNNKLINSDSYFDNGYGTPLLLLVSNNKIQDKVDGLSDVKGYTDFFKKYGYIK